jgi:hypothetical protein
MPTSPVRRLNLGLAAFCAIAMLSACNGLGGGSSSTIPDGQTTAPQAASPENESTGSEASSQNVSAPDSDATSDAGPSTAASKAAGTVAAALAATDDDAPPSKAPAVSSTMLNGDTVEGSNRLNTIVIEEGGVTGVPNKFNPARGDAKAGGHGQTIDHLACQNHMTVNKYHVHAYLGIVVNGKLMADPSALGMLDPQPPINGFTNAAKCYYSIHTHDSSGTIHMEVNRELPLSDSIFTLKNVLDVWGVPHDVKRFGPFKGPIHTFVGVSTLGKTDVTSFREYNGNYENIPLHSHTAIFIEVGSKYYTATQLPEVQFYTEY